MHAIRRFEAIAHLADVRHLSTLFGSVIDVAREPLETPGFSGSRHERLRLRLEGGESLKLVFKRTPLGEVWTAYRSGDVVGREAALLADHAFSPVWDVFANPYVAFATEGDVEGLLMVDLTPHLLPDVRAPIEARVEEALLAHLAALHARFWDSPLLDRAWLCRAADLIGILGPRTGVEDARRVPPPAMLARIQQGWAIALRRLPARVAATLSAPTDAWAERCAAQPRTLIHGDAKIGNFVPLPEGRIAAFDWAMAAAAPPAIELGWYLAVNASRVSDTKEAVILRYRRLLEASLGKSLADTTWIGLEQLAILAGATMLLWSKAIATESGDAAAEAEWDWWARRLVDTC